MAPLDRHSPRLPPGYPPVGDSGVGCWLGLPDPGALCGHAFCGSLKMKKERKPIIAGNWKMNKTVAEALDLVRDLKTVLATINEVDIVVFPPFTALSEVAKVVHGSNIHLGAQNMSEHNIGAHTGEIA